MRKTFFILLALTLAASLGAQSKQPKINSQWAGKRVAILGDSITDARQIPSQNSVYWQDLVDILGIEPFVYGISGHQTFHIAGQADKLEAEHGQGVDAILVFIGTNDYNASVPLGEWYSYETVPANHDGVVSDHLHRTLLFDPDTFRGRLNSMIRHLKTHFPDKQIILLTPIHRGLADLGKTNYQEPEDFANGCGAFIDDYVAAIKEAANVWAVPVIDLNASSGLYPMLDEQSFYFRNPEKDRLHPNTRGHQRMAWTLAYQLMTYPASFPKYVALSFDDGPNTTTTMQALDVMEQYGVPGSFFVNGCNINEETIPVMQRAKSLGCDIENHSQNHKHMLELTNAQVIAEIEMTTSLIEQAVGVAPRFFRPPYIEHDAAMHASTDLCFIYGFDLSDWNKDVTTQQRIDKILGGVQDGDIILLHDFKDNDQTIETLKVIIPELQRRGFTFLTVADLFAIRGGIPAPHNGEIYSKAY
jgi:peptidoglycan/xylan/chitin deacetylase (PgdA/CDA1 family)